MVVGTPNADELIALAASHGVQARVIGEATHEPGIRIRSAGNSPGKKLAYSPDNA